MARGQLGRRVFVVACAIALLWLWWSRLSASISGKPEIDAERLADLAVQRVFGAHSSEDSKLGAECDRQPCKFLMAGRIMEQETKAQ